jgi:hypothetical protein
MNKKITLLFLLFFLTGCPEPRIWLANMDGERNFTIHDSDSLKMKIEDPFIYYPGEILIPIYIVNNNTESVIYQIENDFIYFRESNVNCTINCITDFSYSQWKPQEGPSSVGHSTKKFTDEPPTIRDLNYEIKPDRNARIYIFAMIPKELSIDTKSLKRIEESLESDSIQVNLGHIIIGSDSLNLRKFHLRVDERMGNIYR